MPEVQRAKMRLKGEFADRYDAATLINTGTSILLCVVSPIPNLNHTLSAEFFINVRAFKNTARQTS